MKRNRNTLYLLYGFCGLLLCSAAYAQEGGELEYVDTGNAVLNHAQRVDDPGVVEYPQPLLAEDLASGRPIPRDPFEMPEKKRVKPGSYERVIEGLLLRGVIEVGARRMALFEVSDKKGSVLRRVEEGETLQVSIEDGQLLFTIVSLGKRQATVVGENGTAYKVWL